MMKNFDPSSENGTALPAVQFQTKDGEAFDIPVEGSLGLLAIGDLGIIAWRQKRRQFKQELAARTQQHLQKEQ